MQTSSMRRWRDARRHRRQRARAPGHLYPTARGARDGSVLHYPVTDATLAPYLAEPDTHVQTSAVCLLAAGGNPDKAERLMRKAL